MMGAGDVPALPAALPPRIGDAGAGLPGGGGLPSFASGVPYGGDAGGVRALAPRSANVPHAGGGEKVRAGLGHAPWVVPHEDAPISPAKPPKRDAGVATHRPIPANFVPPAPAPEALPVVGYPSLPRMANSTSAASSGSASAGLTSTYGYVAPGAQSGVMSPQRTPRAVPAPGVVGGALPAASAASTASMSVLGSGGPPPLPLPTASMLRTATGSSGHGDAASARARTPVEVFRDPVPKSAPGTPRLSSRSASGGGAPAALPPAARAHASLLSEMSRSGTAHEPARRSAASISSQPAVHAAPPPSVEPQPLDDAVGFLAHREHKPPAVELEAVAAERRRALEARAVDTASQSTARVLEGKVAGLQNMLEEKSRECERAVAQAQAAHLKLETLLTAGETARRTAEALEQQLGQRGVEAAELARELEKARNEVMSLERSLDDSYRKLQESKRQHEEVLAARDEAEAALRGEARAKARLLQDVEMEKLSQADDAASARADVDAAQQALQRAEGENDALREQLAAAERALRGRDAEDAQRRVVADGVRQELDREAGKGKALLAELRLAEQQRTELEERVRTGEQRVAHLQSFEHHNQHLRDTLSQLEGDLHKEAAAHQATKTELAATAALRDDHAALQRRLHQAEAEVTAKAESMARLHTHLESHAATLASMKAELEKAERERAHAETELEAAEHFKDAMNQRIIDLERDAQRAHELEGRFRAYESMFDERGDDLRAAQQELSDQSRVIRDLESRLDAAAAVERDLADAQAGLQQQQQEIAGRQGQLEAQEEELERVARERDDALALLDRERAAAHGVREEFDALREDYEVKAAAAAQAAALESHIAALRQDVDHKAGAAEELRRHSEQVERALRQAETQRDEADAQAQHQHRVIEDLEVDLGRFTVLTDEAHKEIAKLQGAVREKEGEAAEWRKAADAHQQQVAALQTDLAEAKQREADAAKARAEESDRAAALTKQLQGAAEREAALEKTLGEAEAKALDLEAAAMRCSTFEGKAAALAAANDQKAEELQGAAGALAELRSRLAAAEGEAEQARTMEARIGDLRGQMAAQLAEIENLEGEEARKGAALLEARKELEREVEKGAALQKQVQQEKTLRLETLEKLREAEAAAGAQSALEGRVSGLEILVTQKGEEADAAYGDAEAARRRVKELESELAARARVEEVVEEARYQLSIKDDTIARLERQDAKRREIVEEQYTELSSLTDTARKMDAKLQEEVGRRIDAEARVQELLQEAAVTHRADDATAKELKVDNDRLGYEVRSLRERVLQLERTARVADQKVTDAHDDAGRLRLLLQQTETAKGALGAETEDLRRQIHQERCLVEKLSKDLSEARADATASREKEQRATRAHTEQSRDSRLKADHRTKTLESRGLELEAEKASLERQVAQLKEEKAAAQTGWAKPALPPARAPPTSPHKSYIAGAHPARALDLKDLSTTLTAPHDAGVPRAHGGVVAREFQASAGAAAAVAMVAHPSPQAPRAEDPAEEWARAKESVAALKSTLRHA